MKNSDIDLLTSDEIVNEVPSVKFDDTIEAKEEFKSINFESQDAFLRGLYNPGEHVESIQRIDLDIIEEKAVKDESVSSASDIVVLEGWKNTENYSARLIKTNDQYIVLECFIDKEKGLYEERSFNLSLFKGFKIEIGCLFYIRFFERHNELKMQIHDDPKFDFKDDFTEIDFVQKFKDSKLFM